MRGIYKITINDIVYIGIILTRVLFLEFVVVKFIKSSTKFIIGFNDQ